MHSAHTGHQRAITFSIWPAFERQFRSGGAIFATSATRPERPDELASANGSSQPRAVGDSYISLASSVHVSMLNTLDNGRFVSAIS